MSGEDGGIAYSAGLGIDETGDPVAKEVSFSTSGLQFLTTKMNTVV